MYYFNPSYLIHVPQFVTLFPSLLVGIFGCIFLSFPLTLNSSFKLLLSPLSLCRDINVFLVLVDWYNSSFCCDRSREDNMGQISSRHDFGDDRSSDEPSHRRRRFRSIIPSLPAPGPSAPPGLPGAPGSRRLAVQPAPSQQRSQAALTSHRSQPAPTPQRSQLAPTLRRSQRLQTLHRSQPAPNPQQSFTTQRYSPAHPGDHPSASSRPWKLDTIISKPALDQEILEKYSWNPEDHSPHIFVKPNDRLTCHRHPVAQSTDGIRGKVEFSNGFHVWKFTWPQRMRGTHATIGVATKTAPLHQTGYVSLIGHNAESYGWDLTRNRCNNDARNGVSPWKYPDVPTQFLAPDNIYCILDMDEGYMAFATDDKYLGVAFRGLKGKKLYPAVSCVWGHCEVTMKYLGGLEPEPRQLMDACRQTIMTSLGKNPADGVQHLPLPNSLKNFLMYE